MSDKISKTDFLDFLKNELAMDRVENVLPDYHGRWFFKGIGVVVADATMWQDFIWSLVEDGRFAALRNARTHTDSMAFSTIYAWDHDLFTDEEYDTQVFDDDDDYDDDDY